MARLQVGREDGKKGSEKAVLWYQAETEIFDNLKHELAQELTSVQPVFEKPYILRCDESDFAIGALLSQIIDGKKQHDGFYTRKLASSQLTGLRRKSKCMPWWQPFLSFWVSLIFIQFW